MEKNFLVMEENSLLRRVLLTEENVALMENKMLIMDEIAAHYGRETLVMDEKRR
jgi:hypothetical protein